MIDLIATIDKQREVIDRLRAENAEQQEPIHQLQAVVQDQLTEIETLRELVRDVYKRGMVSPEWDERAEKALTPQT
jgi:uncharacterized coiled-coil protein SlyX